MRALVIGFGSIGKRHIRNIKLLEPNAEIIVSRHHVRDSNVGDLAPLIHQVILDESSLLRNLRIDVAIICNPASCHLDTAFRCVEHGVDLFIEKPLAAATIGVDRLLGFCRDRKLILGVAYNLRFYDPVEKLHDAVSRGLIGRPLSFRIEVGQYLPDWRPWQDYRTGVSARAALGGGALLELSHELDYARWFFGEMVALRAWTGRLGDLEIDVEDTAELIAEYRSGVIGSIHLDFLRRDAHRACRIVGTEGTLVWDSADARVRLFSVAHRKWTEFVCKPTAAHDSYVQEMKQFLEAVRTRTPAAVTGEDGLRILEIVAAAKLAAKTGQRVQL